MVTNNGFYFEHVCKVKQIFCTILIFVDVCILGCNNTNSFSTFERLCLSYRLLEKVDLDVLQCMLYCLLSVCIQRFVLYCRY